MKWNNLARAGGTRTSQTVNPQTLVKDVDDQVRSLEPEATPLLAINKIIGNGPVPKSRKMEVMQHYAFDNWDEVTAVTLGTGAEIRYARLALSQKSRPAVNGSMFYYPQDTFYITATGQNVVAVVTPDAAYKVNGTEMTLGTGLTGNTTTRSVAGSIVVMNIEQSAMVSFTTSDIVFTGRTIYESQAIEAQSTQEDVIFDCNYVEHMECVLNLSGDQQKFVKQYGKLNDLNFQQREKLKAFKKQVHYKLWTGERSMELSQTNRPTYYTRGILKSIKTNVTVYDPTQTDDFERLVSNFMEEQAFRWTPNGREKIGYCGVKFLSNFDRAFREYRRSDLSDKSPTPGFHVNKYFWQGCTLSLIRDETFRQGTSLQNWCVVVDPLESQLCVETNFTGRRYEAPSDRDMKWMWEWVGGIRHHREETSAILRTA